jgi:single-strand DNA-binding protein
MADGLNRVFLMGHLGADGDLKTFSGGSGSVLKLRLACSESYYDKTKQTWQEKTEWVNVSVWGKRGEGLAKFLKKGDKIFVEGSLKTSSFERDGQKHYRTEVSATNVLLTGGNGGRKVTHESSHAAHAAPPEPAEDFGDFSRTDDDETPF